MNTLVKPAFVVQEQDPFAELVSLPNEVTFFVPSTSNVNESNPALAAAMLEHVNRQLSILYGGTTAHAPCSGHWVSDSAGLVTEQVTPVTVYIAELTNQVKRQLVDLARKIKDDMGQEAVLIVVNGEGKLV